MFLTFMNLITGLIFFQATVLFRAMKGTRFVLTRESSKMRSIERNVMCIVEKYTMSFIENTFLWA